MRMTLRRGHLLSALAIVGLCTTFAAIGRSADDELGLGSGKDGAYVANAAGVVVNAYHPLAAAAAAGATSLTVDATDDLAAGDVVMVVQVRAGQLASTTDDPPAAVDLSALGVGQYDVTRITAKNATELTVAPALKNAYAASGAQVIRVPQYTTVDIPDGTSLAAKPWDGTTGGVVAFLATGAVTASGSGTVTATGAGFRGGDRSNAYCDGTCVSSQDGSGSPDDPTCNQGGRGESFDARDEAFGATGCGIGARGTGGGGGGHINAGGAGGGNGGPGGRGGNAWNKAEPYGGYPGAAVDARLVDRLTIGGGGGGGQQNNSPPPADPSDVGRGGRGGGVVWLRGLSLAAVAPIEANGANGFDGASDGAGGGGAGGSVFVRVVTSADCGALRANGGNGGNIGGHGPGGGGGAGRIRLDARTGACPGEAAPGALGAGGAGVVNPPGAAPNPVVEDAGSYGCVVDAGGCAAATPVCDAVTRMCRVCTGGAECPTGYCAPSGQCAAPPADASTSSSSSSSSGASGSSGSSGGATSSSGGATSSSGGATSSGGTSGGAAAPGDGQGSVPGSSGGCSVPSGPPANGGLLTAALGALGALARRRRRAT